jgi:hypothetical protein
VRRSQATEVTLPLDLHVLGLPLAFILSQDQTLHSMIFKLSLQNLSVFVSQFLYKFLTSSMYYSNRVNELLFSLPKKSSLRISHFHLQYRSNTISCLSTSCFPNSHLFSPVLSIITLRHSSLFLNKAAKVMAFFLLTKYFYIFFFILFDDLRNFFQNIPISLLWLFRSSKHSVFNIYDYLYVSKNIFFNPLINMTNIF